jgi:cob(I)alamin adenosyltransferase
VKVYTRRGDAGDTDLFGGPRVGKDDLRVEAYGAVDELNAALGVCASATQHIDLRDVVRHVQDLLFDLGATLATPDAARREKGSVPEPRDEDVVALERQIDALEDELKPLRRFILPGGCHAAAALHVARTVCRRAERRTVALHRQDPLADSCLRVLNRLSDLLFVMARVENHRAGVADVEWAGRER